MTLKAVYLQCIKSRDTNIDMGHCYTHTHCDIAIWKNLIWSESAQWLLSSGVGKIPRAFIMPIGMPIMPPWANAYDVAHLQPKIVPINLIWSESAQGLLSYGICKVWAGRIDGRMDRWMKEWTNEQIDREHSIVPLISFGKGGGQKTFVVNDCSIKWLFL